MRESILVVSLRPESLKLLRLQSATAKPCVTGCLQADLPAGATAEDTARLVRQLASDHGLTADRIILGLDTGQAVLRRLRFPFTAKTKIDLVLGPEFEPYLAAPLQESALSWTATALSPDPAAVALAAAFPLAPLTEILAALTSQGLPPTAACLDLAGLDATVAALLPRAGAAACVSLEGGRLDCLCRLENAPLAWRSLPLPAGDNASQAAGVAREARLTLSPLASRQPQGLTLCLAGCATEPATVAALEESLQTTATPLAALPGWPVLPGAVPLPDSFAAAYGLALLARNGPGTANFLRHQLAPALSRSTLRRSLLLAGGSLALLLLTGMAALVHTYWRLDAAIAAAQAETGAIVAATAPELAPGLTLAQKLSVLRGRLAEQGASARDRDLVKGSMLDMLAAIHQGLGLAGKVQARRVAADGKRVTIDAVADDYTTVDEIKRRLAAMPVFSAVEIKGAKNVPDKKQVEFQLDLKLAGSGEPSS
ncbi:hypothetical protein [Solidesulfovibrio sp.]